MPRGGPASEKEPAGVISEDNEDEWGGRGTELCWGADPSREACWISDPSLISGLTSQGQKSG